MKLYFHRTFYRQFRYVNFDEKFINQANNKKNAIKKKVLIETVTLSSAVIVPDRSRCSFPGNEFGHCNFPG